MPRSPGTIIAGIAARIACTSGRFSFIVSPSDDASPNLATATLVRLYLTKADGMVRFEEWGGNVWNRI